MFQITQEEFINLQSQVGTTNINNMSRTLSYVFTEQGIAMLATILKTDVAEQVSIAIMDAFVLMRKYIATNNYKQRLNNVETKIIEHDNKFNKIFSKLDAEKKNYLMF